MRPLRKLGLAISAAALILLFVDLLPRVNPNLTVADLSLLALLVGPLIISGDAVRMKIKATEMGMTLVTAGWIALSAGAVVAVAGFLLLLQVSCTSTLNGPYWCDIQPLPEMILGGTLLGIIGVVITAVGALFGRTR